MATTPTEARAQLIRRIVSEVMERSFGGTRESAHFRRDLAILGRQEDDISWRVQNELGVEVPKMEWSSFITVRELINYIELEIQRRQGAGA